MNNAIEAFVVTSVDTLIGLYKGDYQKNVDNELLCNQFSDTYDYVGQLERPLGNMFPDIKDKLNNFVNHNNERCKYYKITVSEYKKLILKLVGVK